MKLFLDRNKTLLPRVDKIYLIARVMIFLSLVWVLLFSEYIESNVTLFYIIIGTYTAHLILYYFSTENKFDIKLAYFSTIVYDLMLIPLLIKIGRAHV